MKIFLLFIAGMLSYGVSQATVPGVTVNILPATTVVLTGNVQSIMTGGAFVNNGTYTDYNGTFSTSGPESFSGAGTTNLNNLLFNTFSGTSIFNSLVSVYNATNITAGNVNANNELYVRSDAGAATMINSGVLTNNVLGLKAIASQTTGAGCTPYNSSLSLNVSGTAMRYQWQSSPDSATWANVSGATNATYSASVTATIYYRCNLTTSNTAFSEPTPGIMLFLAVPPVINAGAGTVLCAGATTTLTATGGATYSWAPSTALTTTSGSSVSANPLSNITYTVTGTSLAGCSSTAMVSVTVNQLPVVGVSSGIINPLINETLCNGATTTDVNFSSTIGGTTYTWTNTNSTIGIASTGSGNILSFVTANTSTTPATAIVAVTPFANGCPGAPKSFSITVNPAATMFAPISQTVCSGQSTSNIVFSSPVSGTSYSWSATVNSIGLGSGATGGAIAPFVTASSTTAQVATVTVTPSANSCTGSPASFTITVLPTPNVIPSPSQALCTGTPIAPVTFSGYVSGTSYTWTNSNTSINIPSSGSGNVPDSVVLNFGTTPVISVITVTPHTASCTGPSQSFNVTVNPTPSVVAVGNQAICGGTSFSGINFTGPVSGTQFNWSGGKTSIGFALPTGSGGIVPFTAANSSSVPVMDTLTVTPVANGCAGPSTNFILVVVPTPNVAPQPNQALCFHDYTANIHYTSSDSNVIYKWWNSNGGIGIVDSAYGDIPSFQAINFGVTPITGIITVIPSLNVVVPFTVPDSVTCVGSARTFSITVYPTPTVDSLASQILCNGVAAGVVNFSGAVSGTQYYWTSSDSTIGLPASDSGNIVSFTTTNGGSGMLVDSVTVTPRAHGCIGTPRKFGIAVKPTPGVVTIPDLALCNNATTDSINFVGTVPGTTYTWTNSNTAIGMVSSGTGNILPFIVSDGDTATITGLFSVVPVANGCAGATHTFNITVYPTPGIGTIFSQNICNGSLIAASHFNGSFSGINYNWTGSNSTIGLAISGTGNIPAFTVVNTGTVTVVDSITVTPSANGCVGAPGGFVITAVPTPAALTPASQTVCNNGITAPVSFTGNVSGTVFNWSNSDTSIGLAANGTGNISSFVALDSAAVPFVGNITFVPIAFGCAGAPGNFAYTVNPTPTVITPAGQSVCNGVQVSQIIFSGPVSGTAFNWVSPASIGIPSSGSGYIPAFTSNNPSGSTETDVIRVTPSANGCVGPSGTVDITVYPSPAHSQISIRPAGADICLNANYLNFGTGSAAPSGMYYTWTVTNAVLWSTGANSQYCLVSFPYYGPGEVVLTTTDASSSCMNQTSYSFNVSTNPATSPALVYYNSHFICLENDADSYQWGYDNGITMSPTVIPGAVNQNYYDPSPDFTNNYYWVVTSINGCSQKTYYGGPPSGVSNVPVQTGFSMDVFPNPADNVLNVSLKGATESGVEARLYDVTGKQVSAMPLYDNKAVFNVSGIAPGCYVVGCYKDGIRITSATFIRN